MYEKLKETVHYILAGCKDKPNVGKVVLFKLLYFSDFNFYKKHYEPITGTNYRKLDFGPAPQKEQIDPALRELEKEGKIKISVSELDGSYKFKILKEPEIKILSKEEIEVIDRVIERLGHCNASEISKISHLDTPWQVTPKNKIIKY